LPFWIKSHVRAFEFFGGVAQILVPDNLKSGVTFLRVRQKLGCKKKLIVFN